MYRWKIKCVIWLTFGLQLSVFGGCLDSSEVKVKYDHLGNQYQILNHGVQKTAVGGAIVDRFERRAYGRLSNLDVSNPMKMILFFEDLSRVVILDKNLSEVSSLELEKSGLDQVVAVCAARQGGIWVFDVGNFQLSRLDELGNQLQFSGNLTNTVQVDLDITGLFESKSNVYLVNHGQGIVEFDQMGNFIREIKLKGLVSAWRSGTTLYYATETKVMAYDLIDFTSQMLGSYQGDHPELSFHSNGVALHSSEGTKIYCAKR